MYYYYKAMTEDGQMFGEEWIPSLGSQVNVWPSSLGCRMLTWQVPGGREWARHIFWIFQKWRERMEASLKNSHRRNSRHWPDHGMAGIIWYHIISPTSHCFHDQSNTLSHSKGSLSSRTVGQVPYFLCIRHWRSCECCCRRRHWTSHIDDAAGNTIHPGRADGSRCCANLGKRGIKTDSTRYGWWMQDTSRGDSEFIWTRIYGYGTLYVNVVQLHCLLLRLNLIQLQCSTPYLCTGNTRGVWWFRNELYIGNSRRGGAFTRRSIGLHSCRHTQYTYQQCGSVLGLGETTIQMAT